MLCLPAAPSNACWVTNYGLQGKYNTISIITSCYCWPSWIPAWCTVYSFTIFTLHTLSVGRAWHPSRGKIVWWMAGGLTSHPDFSGFSNDVPGEIFRWWTQLNFLYASSSFSHRSLNHSLIFTTQTRPSTQVNRQNIGWSCKVLHSLSSQLYQSLWLRLQKTRTKIRKPFTS